MVVEERGHRGGGVGQHLVEAVRTRCTPPSAGGSHRGRRGSSPPRSRNSAVEPAAPEARERLRLAREADDLGGHAQIARAAGGSTAAPAGRLARAWYSKAPRSTDTEKDMSLASVRHLQGAEQADEMRVVPLVVDDEPGVHRDRPSAVGDRRRVGVTAQRRAGLEHGDIVRARERPRGPEARDAAADHRDLHVRFAPIPTCSHAARSWMARAVVCTPAAYRSQARYPGRGAAWPIWPDRKPARRRAEVPVQNLCNRTDLGSDTPRRSAHDEIPPRI